MQQLVSFLVAVCTSVWCSSVCVGLILDSQPCQFLCGMNQSCIGIFSFCPSSWNFWGNYIGLGKKTKIPSSWFRRIMRSLVHKGEFSSENPGCAAVWLPSSRNQGRGCRSIPWLKAIARVCTQNWDTGRVPGSVSLDGLHYSSSSCDNSSQKTKSYYWLLQ